MVPEISSLRAGLSSHKVYDLFHLLDCRRPILPRIGTHILFISIHQDAGMSPRSKAGPEELRCQRISSPAYKDKPYA